MTTYNTGNALGSVDVRDLYDNAENLDNFENGPLNFYADRLGVSRQSLQGIRNASQYQIIGAYGAGLNFTSYNQVFSYLGEFYAPSAGLTLPYTTTGAGAGEVASFRSVGDAILRSDLAASGGAALIGRNSQTVSSIASLRTLLKTSPSKDAFVTGYYAQGDGGGGAYWYDSADVVSADNGGSVIVAADGARWKLLNTSAIDVRQFGAKCDGITVDTEKVFAAYLALSSGGIIQFPSGATTLIDASWVLNKPVVIKLGGAREAGKLKFKASGTYLSAPFKAAIIVKHSTTVIPGYSTGDARRSRIEGGSIVCEAGTSGLRGVLACAPAYYSSLQVSGFSSDGFAVIATDGTIDGNANGCSFKDTESIGNSGSGYYFNGSDSNACSLHGARAFDNDWGFFDDSLLGNTYLMCEADLNASGGYFSPVSPSTNRSSYFGCYSEGNQPAPWSLGEKAVCIAPQGIQPNTASGGLSVSMLPSSVGYFSSAIRWAASQDIANTMGTGGFPGTATEIANGQIKIQTLAGVDQLKLADLDSSYAALSLGSVNSMQIPYSSVTGNIQKGRPYFGNGLSFGGSGRSAIVGSGTAAPTTGTYDRGAIFFNDLPAASGFIGWTCVSAGTPGTWNTFGAISA